LWIANEAAGVGAGGGYFRYVRKLQKYLKKRKPMKIFLRRVLTLRASRPIVTKRNVTNRIVTLASNTGTNDKEHRAATKRQPPQAIIFGSIAFGKIFLSI